MDPEKIILELDASKVESGRKPLHALIEDLKGIENHAKAVNAALNGMSGIGSVTGLKDLNAEIEAMQRKSNRKGGGGVADIVKRLNLDADSFDRYLARYKQQVKDLHGFNAKTREFGSIGGAAGAVHRYQQGQTDIVSASGLTLAKLLGRPVVAEANSGVAGAEIVAALKELTAKLAMGPSSAPSSAEATEGREAGTGRFTGGGGGGKKKPKGKQELNIDRQPGELERTRVETETALRETIVQATELGTTVATTYDSVDAILKTVTKSSTAKTLKEQLKQQRALSLEGFKAAKQGMGHAELAKLQISQAAALEGLLTPDLMEQLKDSNQGHVAEQIKAQAATLKAQAAVSAGKARAAAAAAEQARMFAPSASAPLADFYKAKERRQAFLDRQAERVEAHEFAVHDRQRKVLEDARRAATPPVIPGAKTPKTPESPFARGLRSFTPTGIAANLLNVSGWALSVGILYKSLEAVNYALGRMTVLGEGTARLGNVFHGIGGSAQQLAGDLVRVAAAQGRTSEEMLGTGADFSRIYRSRNEVGAASEAAAKLANATGLDAGQTGGMLGTLARVYGIGAGGLGGAANSFEVLREKFKVNPAEMVTAIQKNAAVARQAGYGPEQMMALIMGTAGKSGLPGSSIESMFRTSLQNLRTLPVQDFLRQRGIRSAGGSGREVLGELAGRFEGMGEKEQQMFGARIAGPTGAARFVEMMKEYRDALDAASASRGRLNDLEEASNRIRETSKGQQQGMKAAWDAFLNHPLVDRAIGQEASRWTPMGLVDQALEHGMPAQWMTKLLASSGPVTSAETKLAEFARDHGWVGGRATWADHRRMDDDEAPNRATETEEPLDLREQRVATAKARHQMGGEMLGSLFGQFPQDLMSLRMSNRIGLLRGEDERIGTSLGGLQGAGGVPGPESMAEINRLDERRREVRGELSAAGAAAPLAEMFDRRQLAFTRAGQEAQGYGVGTWEAEKLTNRRNELTNQLRRAPGPGGGSENEQVRALQMEIELWRTKQQIQERIIALRAEEKQIALDANREFSRSLITAGPGELLRKLAVLKLGGPEGKSLTAGGFFAMDAGSRGIYDQLRGGEAGARNRAERRLLGNGQSVEQQQAERAASGAAINARIRPLGKLATDAGAGALGNEAKIAAANLTAMSGALASATAAVLAFAKALPGGGGAAKPAAAPGGGISTGYQVGSNPPPAKDFHDGSTVLTGFHL